MKIIEAENNAQVGTIGDPMLYNWKSDGSKLNGYLVMLSNILPGRKVPDVLQFYTGAGLLVCDGRLIC